MKTKLDTKRITLFLVITFGLAWGISLIIYLTGGLENSPVLIPGTPITLAIILLAIPVMWSPAIGNILTRLITKEGRENLYLRPHFKRSWRYWLAVLTAFTLAHSISMAAALMGWVTLSAQIVEPLIAASILLMAALNLWRKHQSVLTRVLIVFACGLLHGLGFASAIADIGLHAKHQFVSLLGFNLGVEIGQVIFVGVAMGLAFGLRWITGPAAQEGSTRDPLRILPTLGSAIALGLSSMWLVQRVSL